MLTRARDELLPTPSERQARLLGSAACLSRCWSRPQPAPARSLLCAPLQAVQLVLEGPLDAGRLATMLQQRLGMGGPPTVGGSGAKVPALDGGSVAVPLPLLEGSSVGSRVLLLSGLLRLTPGAPCQVTRLSNYRHRASPTHTTLKPYSLPRTPTHEP